MATGLELDAPAPELQQACRGLIEPLRQVRRRPVEDDDEWAAGRWQSSEVLSLAALSV